MSEPVNTADGRVLDAVEVAALDSIGKRLSWASLHWGTEAVSSEAWPHIAIAAAAAVRERIAAEIEAERLSIKGGDPDAEIGDLYDRGRLYGMSVSASIVRDAR